MTAEVLPMTASELGDMLGGLVWETIKQAQLNAPRTLQSENRTLGMSDLGACREYIRATIAGDERWPGEELKLSAYVGTATGDKIEDDMKAALAHVATQRRVTLEIEVDGQKIRVTGSADLLFIEPYQGMPPGVLDIKSVDGIANVVREGPSFKQKVQISGYLLASIQQGVLPADALGVLWFFDRSGKDRTYWTWTVTPAQAQQLVDTAAERLSEVSAALASGRHAPRDEPESWCWHVQCPFYQSCWAGYQPSGAIESERELDAVRRYTEARRDQKDVVKRLDVAKTDLQNVEGVTPDGTTVTWIVAANNSRRIDVREPKG